MNKPIHTSSKITAVVAFALLATALAVSLGAMLIANRPVHPALAVLAAAVVGVGLAHAGVGLVWRLSLRVTRGWPFRKGDVVEITSDGWRGCVGSVVEVIPERTSVCVRLADAGAAEPVMLAWDEVRKTREHQRVETPIP